MTKGRIVVLFTAIVAVVGLVLGAVVNLGGSLGETKALDQPGQCKTALQTTTSCRGEDMSFTECRYYFRAEGVPQAEVCRAFLSGPDAAPVLDASTRACDQTSPAGWRRTPCADVALPADLACFLCSAGPSDATRTLVQALAPACDRAIVLVGCNVDVTRMPTLAR